MIRARALIAAAVLAGCGGGEPAPTAPVDVEAMREGRTIVAEVNGEPVFADCVETQAAAQALPVADALQQCIDFELLAQEARARGYAQHAAVRAARKTEAVRALVEHGFVPAHDDPADIPDEQIKTLWSRPEVHSRYNHPEYRWGLYARAELPKDEPADSERDQRAQQAMETLHRRLAGKKLDRQAFFAAAEAVVAEYDDVTISISRKPYNTPRKGRADENFAAALFSIPEVGQVSEPTRTPWGWDVVFLTKIMPARWTKLAAAEAELREIAYAPWRKQAFLLWTKQLAEGKHIDVDQTWLERLAADPTDGAGALGRP